MKKLGAMLSHSTFVFKTAGKLSSHIPKKLVLNNIVSDVTWP